MHALPDYYAQSRLLLLPTSADCWGVVINEAMIAGTPVITTEWTAAAGELVLHERNGYVLPLDVAGLGLGCERIALERFQVGVLFPMRPAGQCKQFNYDRAAAGILDAFAYLGRQP